MNVVIVGGNECMVHNYKVLCEEYQCKAKVYPKLTGKLKGIGKPDLLVLFIGTVSHKMVQNALREVRGLDTRVVRSCTSSMSALKNILEENSRSVS